MNSNEVLNGKWKKTTVEEFLTHTKRRKVSFNES